MSIENFRDFSGPVQETESPRKWYLVIDQKIGIEEWEKHCSQNDEVIVGAIKVNEIFLPCVGLGAASHSELENYLNDLNLDGAEVIDPFHLQIKIDDEKKLRWFNSVKQFDLELEIFAQRLLLLLPREIVASPKVILQDLMVFGKILSWFKYVGENTLTEIKSLDFRGTELEGKYITIESVTDDKFGQQYHATKLIEDFPEELMFNK